MTFSTIIYKNLKFNFTKYVSYYLVNSFIVAILFMYGSLMFNKVMLDEIGRSGIFESIRLAFSGIVMFSIVFISYTSIYFMKHRGKEFGVYLTLGMTTKNLRRMTLFENVIISIISLISGIITGLLFSRIFYMIIGKILNIQKNIYYISYKTFLLSAVVFIVIIIFNQIFINIYIYKLSVIEVIKSSSKKETSTSTPIIGISSLIIFMITLYVSPQTLLNRIFSGNSVIITVSIVLSIICPYFIIGSFISLVKEIARKFPDFYNKNLLVLTNLSHRFFAYKAVLYIVSILAAGAIFFIGFSYSAYSTVDKDIDERFPYELMFVQENGYNNVSSDVIRGIIKENGGTIDKYSVLEYMTLPEYRVKDDKVLFWSPSAVITSQTNYNNHMNANINVKPGESVCVKVIKQNIKLAVDYDTIYVLDGNDKMKERMKIFNEKHEADIDKFNITADKYSQYRLSKDKVQYISEPFTNFVLNQVYDSYEARIINDSDYDKLLSKIGKSKICKYHLINIKTGDKVKISEAISTYLKTINTSKDAYKLKEYSPVSKLEMRKTDIETYGFYFFSMLFLGMLFLVASAIVLYYKLITDIEEEKFRIKSINRIGITTTEGIKILTKQLFILFFTPVIVGSGLGLYYLYVMYSNCSFMTLLIQKSIIIVGAYALFQILFYFGMKSNLVNEVLD